MRESAQRLALGAFIICSMQAIARRLAELVVAGFGLCARGLLHLCPPGAQERSAAEKLRAEFRALAPGKTEDDSEAAADWLRWRRTLHENLRSRDPRAFLTWKVIRETMLAAPYAGFVSFELSALRAAGWKTWKRVIRERMTGLPFPCLFYPLSSATAIHHAYHLWRFQRETGVRVSDFSTIVEFGGGYGSMRRIAHQAGFRGTYVLYDLPEFAALQRYYLTQAGLGDTIITTDLDTLSGAVERARSGTRLFMATWSLSEAPLELRKNVLALVRDFDAFLIAYQERFHEIDNRAFFAGWPSLPIAQLPANYYSFGLKQSGP